MTEAAIRVRLDRPQVRSLLRPIGCYVGLFAIVTVAACSPSADATAPQTSASHSAATANQLDQYTGVWTDMEGRWTLMLFEGPTGIIEGPLSGRARFMSHDQATGSDSFEFVDDLVGARQEVIFRREAGGPGHLWIAVRGGGGRMAYLRQLSAADRAKLSAQLGRQQASLRQKLEPKAEESQRSGQAVSASAFAGKDALEVLLDPRVIESFNLKTRFGDAYDELTCVMGSSATVEVQDSRYLTAFANPPPACGPEIQGASFVLDFATRQAAIIVDVSTGGEDWLEQRHGDHAALLWLDGRYAD